MLNFDKKQRRNGFISNGFRCASVFYALNVSYIQYNGTFSVSHCNEKAVAFLRKKFASSMLNVSHCSEEDSCYRYINTIKTIIDDNIKIIPPANIILN